MGGKEGYPAIIFSMQMKIDLSLKLMAFRGQLFFGRITLVYS